MTSSEPIIERLRVEAFRGFRDLREFDLSAAAVIVTGPNGTGKTSFFDALQWGFLGSLERLERLRSRRTVEHIVNQYRLGRKAVIEIDLRLASGTVTARRTGDHSGSTLELLRPGQCSVFGADAEDELRDMLLPKTDLSLKSALTTSGLMQQDVMRRVLEAKPSDRYRQLSTVLGLGKLEDFEEAMRVLARQASELEKSARVERDRLAEALQQAQVRLKAAQSQLASRPLVVAVRDEVRTALAQTPEGVVLNQERTRLEGPETVSQFAAEFGSAADIVSSVQALTSRIAGLRATLMLEPSDEELSTLRDAVARTADEVTSAEAARAAMQEQLKFVRRAAAEVSQLAALAVPMLSNECPVCGQAIDRQHVEGQLRERAEGIGAILELQRALEDRSQAHASALATAQFARDALSAAEDQVAKWADVRSASAEAAKSFANLGDEITVVHFLDIELESFEAVAALAVEYFRRIRRALYELLEAFDRQTDQGAVDRATAEIRSLEGSLSSAERELTAEFARAQRLQSLSEHSVVARVEVTETRLRAIQPLVANIFQRLDPHPAFKTVEFELDTYYRKGTTSPLVTDTVEGVSADPLLIFSTSQANIVALSYFIAMSLSAEERGLPFLLLDDPVQSMDDVNVLGFADLCRHLRLRRQLIVSTHERRFAGLLERKLAPRAAGSSTKLIRFTGWDRSGPTVEERFVEPQLLEDPIRVVQLAG